MVRRITKEIKERRFWVNHKECDICKCVRDVRYDVDCPKCAGRYTGEIIKAPNF